MPQKFLNLTDIDPIHQKVRGKAVTKRMYRDVFGNVRVLHCRFERGLDGFVADVVPSNPAAARVDGQSGGREYVLPYPEFSRIWVFTSERIGKIHFAPPCGNVFAVKLLNCLEVFNESIFNSQRQYGGAILVWFALVVDNFSVFYEVRFLSLLTGHTKSNKAILHYNYKIFCLQ